jgi:hypothetical protein
MEFMREGMVSLIRGLALVGLVPNVETYFGRMRGIVRRKVNVIVMSNKAIEHIYFGAERTTYDLLVWDAYLVDFYLVSN